MRVRRRELLVGLPVALALRPSSARADDVGDALAEITKARAGLSTLEGSFTQERTIGLLATVVKSEGEMTLVRPDRLRWELRPPDAITYWIGPEGLAYATPNGSGSIGKGAAGRFGAVLGDLMTLMGGDLAALRARYDLAVQRDPAGSGSGMQIVARPQAEDVRKHVKSLTLRLPANLWSVQRIEIEEVSGDRSVIAFPQVARDTKVDPARMVPPKKSG